MSEEYNILHGTALEPNLIGPTLPSIPPFTLPTGIGITGPTGATGLGILPVFGTITSEVGIGFSAVVLIQMLILPFQDLLVELL